MKKPSLLQKLSSYFFEVRLKNYQSNISGSIYIALENGKKVLNTNLVNYSYNSLHRVFKTAFKKTSLQNFAPKHILLLGLGGGSIVQILRNDYQIMAPIACVEIDPVIIDIAINEFAINKYNPIEIHEADAFEFVDTCTQNYDLICIDVFINDQVPINFLSPSTIQKVIQLLHKNGRIYFNVMISNASYKIKLQELNQYLTTQLNSTISNVNSLQIEENNQVLIITK